MQGLTPIRVMHWYPVVHEYTAIYAASNMHHRPGFMAVLSIAQQTINIRFYNIIIIIQFVCLCTCVYLFVCNSGKSYNTSFMEMSFDYRTFLHGRPPFLIIVQFVFWFLAKLVRYHPTIEFELPSICT